MPTPILQSYLPDDMRSLRALPGIQPLDPAQWLLVDEAYGAQVAHKLALVASGAHDVLRMQEGAMAAAQELLAQVVCFLSEHNQFEVQGDRITCPDGRRVMLDHDQPLQMLAHLVQEDFCILQKPEGGAEHMMTAALLGFPASWRLCEKIGRPLGAIHDPVDEYDANIARRVQRLFDGVQVGRPLWRHNALWYEDPELHQPYKAGTHTDIPKDRRAYFRSERQTVSRLPKTGAVVFSIHTYVLAHADMKEART